MMSTQAKAYRGMAMEGGIARWYDRTTRRDMEQFRELAARIAAVIRGKEVVEIAPGPGFLSIEMAKRGLSVQAFDISRTFVEIARRNASAESVSVRFNQGNAAALPLESSSTDFVVCRAAFKNFTQPVEALAEMRRVLRPGGKALLIDLRRDTQVIALRKYAESLGVSSLNRWFILLTFRAMLLRRAYRVEDIVRMARTAGWSEPQIELTPVGFEAWMRK